MWRSIGEQFGEALALTASYVTTWVVLNARDWWNAAFECALPFLEPVVLKAVFWYNKQWVHLQHVHQHTYASYPLYRGLVGVLCRIGGTAEYMWNTVRGVETELAEPWICVYGYQPDITVHKTHTLKYHEIVVEETSNRGWWITRYIKSWWFNSSLTETSAADTPRSDTPEPTEVDVSVISAIATQYERQTPVFNQDYTPIVITKWQGKYSCYVCSPPARREQHLIKADTVESEVEILFVEYHHPDMSAPVLLNLPKSMMNVGNEILSSVFILKLLEQTGAEFVFDARYYLRCMDGDVNMFELASKQYITLGATSYKIECV